MLFMLLLRFTAPVMVWVLIIGVLGAGAYGKQYYPHVKCLPLHRFATTDMFKNKINTQGCFQQTLTFILKPMCRCLVSVMQGYGTATGSMKTTGRPLLPLATLVSPPTSMFTYKFKRPGWHFVSLIKMLSVCLIFFINPVT